jgi:hypothetical protein
MFLADRRRADVDRRAFDALRSWRVRRSCLNLDWQLIGGATPAGRRGWLFRGSPHRLDRHVAVATPGT